MVALSLYIHVPFCTRKCDYCNFYVLPGQKRFITQYLKTLAQEIALYKQEITTNELTSIYFGGGTPSLLEPDEVATILRYLPHPKNIEITLEANPESLTLAKVKALKKAGINRLSIGVQSFIDKELASLSREHNAARAREAVLAAKRGGIDNISIDLIYDLPGQSLTSFGYNVEEATKLPITHLSLYNLTIEPHTVFYKKRERLTKLQPRERESLAMLNLAVEHLEKNGFPRYELSAFGRKSVHNSGYWTGRSYLGLGPSAHSYYGGERRANHAHFHRWRRAIEEGEWATSYRERLRPDEAMRERLVVGLRLREGVEVSKEIEIPELYDLEGEGLITLAYNRVLLTERGKLFYDHVAERLI